MPENKERSSLVKKRRPDKMGCIMLMFGAYRPEEYLVNLSLQELWDFYKRTKVLK